MCIHVENHKTYSVSLYILKPYSSNLFAQVFYILPYWKPMRKWKLYVLNFQNVPGSNFVALHYNHVIMTLMASQITSLTLVYSTIYSGADQKKHQSSASLAFVREFTGDPVNSTHKGPVTRKMFPFDDVIMVVLCCGFVMVCFMGDFTDISEHQLSGVPLTNMV